MRRVNLQVGQLRQVVPETLRYCWTLVSEGTPLAGSVLEVESVPARIACRVCAHTEELTAMVLRCGACASDQVSVVAGEEFLVTTLDLAEV